MKHAGDEVLDQLEATLASLRTIAGLVERKRGVFYRKSQAFLHFHEDPAGVFADVRTDEGWKRIGVTTLAARRKLVRVVRKSLRDKS